MGIAQYFSNKFYEEDKSAQPNIGSIYWVPTSDTSEVPTILDVKRASPSEHEITDFSFVQIGSQHFGTKDQLPVKKLNLEDNSELVVTKAKKRPCIVLGLAGVLESEIKTIEHPSQQRQARHLSRVVHIVAPMFSCSTAQENGSFGPEITRRIKVLSYPHLAYFPPFKIEDLSFNPGSILRLDLAFPTYLLRGCEKSELKVNEEVMDIIQEQFKYICGNVPSDDFIEIKQLLEESLGN